MQMATQLNLQINFDEDLVGVLLKLLLTSFYLFKC